MTTPSPKDQIDRWIADVVPGRTFVDIGGIGVNSTNERVTFAARSGARRAAMADIRPFSYYEWTVFDEKCAAAGVTDIDRYDNVDITSPQLADLLPRFDVVHCTGIFYHLPSPVSAFDTLQRVVGQHLIVNTVTIPERVSNDKGILEYSGNVALLLAGLSGRERAILDAHYQGKFGWKLDEVAPPLEAQDGAVMPFIKDGQLSCWPYWWLMTDDCFRSLIRLMGFVIRDEYKWEDHCLFCLCERAEGVKGG
jgi:hypothetical protein